jgi:hypothetical protein
VTVQTIRFTASEAQVPDATEPPVPQPVTVVGSDGLFAEAAVA